MQDRFLFLKVTLWSSTSVSLVSTSIRYKSLPTLRMLYVCGVRASVGRSVGKSLPRDVRALMASCCNPSGKLQW